MTALPVLTQAEADRLLAEPKREARGEAHTFPAPAGHLVIPLVSIDGRRDFLVDVSRSQLRLERIWYQLRARRVDILCRLCLNGKRHTNPDSFPPEGRSDLLALRGITMPATHLHIYIEGFDDSWAVHAPQDLVPAPPDPVRTLRAFLRRCGLVDTPILSKGLDLFGGFDEGV